MLPANSPQRRGGWFLKLLVVAIIAMGCASGLKKFSPPPARADSQPVVSVSSAAERKVPLATTKLPAERADPEPKELPNKTHLGLSYVQQRNASLIVRVGRDMNMPRKAWIIAVSTALQECFLHNCANNNLRYPRVVEISMALPYEGVASDHDSVGLFQQRPVEGDGHWGKVVDLMNKEHSTRLFYAALNKVDGWQDMAVTIAAQAVQRSGFPNAYAKHEDRATALVDYVLTFKLV